MRKKIYKLGRRKEYKIVEDLRKKGYNIVQRTAGSHSPVDVIGINKSQRIIMLIQSKRVLKGQMSDKDEDLVKSIGEEYDWLNGRWDVIFKVL